jgi:hypothetical protein
LTGPRDYSVGTERALVALSQGTCYYPDCDIPVIVFIEGRAVTNVQIAHISGAHPGSPRFDPALSDQDRASFDNLVLLCKPHHDLVDRIDPDRFAARVLKEWKMDREGPGIAALRGLRGLTEGRLEEMLEKAIRTVGPQREVTLEVVGGVFLGGGVATGPLDGWRTVLDMNPSVTGTRVVAAILRNTGALPASLHNISIYFLLGPAGSRGQFSLLGRNDFPVLNPSLPARLEVGEGITWLTSLETFQWVVTQLTLNGVKSEEFRVEAMLGSGERITSGPHALALLPVRGI